MDEIIERVTPYNAVAEQSVLGAILMDRDCISTVINYVRAEDFYDPRNKEMFEAMLDLFNVDKPIDIISVAEQLRRNKTFDKIGGELFIADIANSVSTSANVKFHAKIVSDYALRRKLIQTANRISDLAYKGEESVETILDASEQDVFDISRNRNRTGFMTMRDLLSVSFSHVSEMATNPKKITGVPTGFEKIDEKIFGLNKSNLIIIAARPAMGKTAFALNIAQYAAMKANAKVAIFSLEMSSEENVNRMWFSEAMVESDKIRKGNMQQNDWARLTTALSI